MTPERTPGRGGPVSPATPSSAAPSDPVGAPSARALSAPARGRRPPALLTPGSGPAAARTGAVRPLAERIAAAPVSWGVCEVPGWGHQMASGRVLAEMTALGVAATEFGPAGFLPVEPGRRAAVLAEHGLAAVGGFVPAVLHDPGHDPLPAIRAGLKAFTASGARTLVLAAATGLDGYDGRPAPGAGGWRTLLAALERIAAEAASAGVTAVLHPHVGTMVENADEVGRVLDHSGIGLCLDTGHLLVGGTDPVEIARRHPGRIAHVHLKDVDEAAARDVREGRTGYSAAVAAGMYRPLGGGDLDIAGLVGALEAAGYPGWYVMEQDTVLTGEPDDGEGPVADVRVSVAYLRGLADGPAENGPAADTGGYRQDREDRQDRQDRPGTGDGW